MDWFRKRNKNRRLKKWWDEELKRQKEIEDAKVKIRNEVFTSPAAYGRWLETKGFENIGRGYYGSVYAHPTSNKVIKILDNPSNDGWLDYVMWAGKQGYGGTFAPLVYSYKEVKIKGKPNTRCISPINYNYENRVFGVAVLERMEKIVSRVDKASKEALITSLIHFGVKEKNTHARNLANNLFPGLSEFMEKLIERFDKEGRFDLHDANMMFRKDGTLAITDPIANIDRKKDVKLPTRLKAGDFSPALIYNFKGLLYGTNCVRFN